MVEVRVCMWTWVELGFLLHVRGNFKDIMKTIIRYKDWDYLKINQHMKHRKHEACGTSEVIMQTFRKLLI